ncbi:hypothetical protein EGI22_15230, partial [Lacihabitans sp. LS3-19]|uniref:Ig domain-containing protein n=1 Tax=Lacihabitans sp. LS3-19 TaxID=2487335 RepID=UPI0020CEA763
ITNNPSATISYAGTPYCSTASPASVSLTGTTGGGFTSAPAGLTINATTGQITPSSSTAGVYTVTYTIAASGGCSSATATTSVTISSGPPIINQPQNVSICQGNNATFTVQTNLQEVTYQWEVNLGTGFVPVAASAVYSGYNTATLSLAFPPIGYNNYQYRCVVSKNGCSAISSAATLSMSGSAEALNIVNLTPISGVYIQTAVAYTIALNKIELNANVLFKSGNAIELLPGFETRAGAVFATKIESPCGVNSTNNSIFENLPKEIKK